VTLGRKLAKAGHDVVFGTRDPSGEKVKVLLKECGAKASAQPVSKAVIGAQVVVLATPWAATQQAVKEAGGLKGKVVVDCTNPLAPDLGSLVVGHTTSGGEQIASWIPEAHVVKAFNSTGSGNMEAPHYHGQALTMFICGDDTEARKTVTRLVEEIGFEVCDAGPLAMSRCLEPLAMLWIALAYRQGLGVNIGLKLLRR
jgi:predicted dinucleotide-binding enzyme